ncbi:MAG: YjgN family protein [Ignavibacteria bacterium]
MEGEQASGEFEAFSFTGRGGEYFRIWIVNLLLSICTLGIYSAWAKVRREQYFHRNTLLAGSGFDYHGKPTAILKGRLVAVALLILLGITEKVSPTLHTVLLLAAVPVVPWLIQRSLRFRTINTSYRGLRFRHRGTYKEAFVAHVVHGGLTMITAGLWMPVWMRAAKRFQLDKLSYGSVDFSCAPSTEGYYGAYFKAGLMILGAVALAGILAALAVPALGPDQRAAAPVFFALIPLVFLAGYSLLARPYLQVRLANLTWNATAVGGRKFASTQTLGSFLKIHAVNVVLTLLTLGLYWPWAKVREAAYRAARTAVDAADLDALIGHEAGQPSAVGEEIADVFDLDVAL